jgi:hypothetical protein
MNTCSCLNLVLACIVYWQAREISRVLSQCDPFANGVDTLGFPTLSQPARDESYRRRARHSAVGGGLSGHRL